MRTTLSILPGFALLISISIAEAKDPTPGDTLGASSGVILACPEQDGPTLMESGLNFRIRITMPDGVSIPGVSENDIWLGSDEQICGGRILIADAPTDESGVTSFTGALRGGGCYQMFIMVRRNNEDRMLGKDSDGRISPIILPIRVVSPDIDADGDVDSVDRNRFEAAYRSGRYNECADFDSNGSVDNEDLRIFEQHFGHTCRP